MVEEEIKRRGGVIKDMQANENQGMQAEIDRIDGDVMRRSLGHAIINHLTDLNCGVLLMRYVRYLRLEGFSVGSLFWWGYLYFLDLQHCLVPKANICRQGRAILVVKEELL